MASAIRSPVSPTFQNSLRIATNMQMAFNKLPHQRLLRKRSNPLMHYLTEWFKDRKQKAGITCFHKEHKKPFWKIRKARGAHSSQWPARCLWRGSPQCSPSLRFPAAGIQKDTASGTDGRTQSHHGYQPYPPLFGLDLLGGQHDILWEQIAEFNYSQYEKVPESVLNVQLLWKASLGSGITRPEEHLVLPTSSNECMPYTLLCCFPDSSFPCYTRRPQMLLLVQPLGHVVRPFLNFIHRPGCL